MLARDVHALNRRFKENYLTSCFNHMSPPRLAERAYELTGLSRNYILPEGLSGADIEAYTGALSSRARKKAFPVLADTLAALNPEVAPLRAKLSTQEDLWDFIFGITSGFSPRDMAFFISLGGGTGARKKIPGYKARTEGLFRRGVLLQWIPAPETLDAVEAQLAQKGPHYKPSLEQGLQP